MSAHDALQGGKPDEALAELQHQVRNDPANAKHRIFLFQLLGVLGQWERAFTQLKVAGDLDAGTLAMVQTYREALHCEALREAIFAGERTPLVFGDPEQWVAVLIEALRLTAAGKYLQSQQVREEAFEVAPATSGTIDGQKFEWIADGDTRMGPVLEAIINGRYYWVPFHRIRTIDLEEPADLRDLVWMPAHFTWANGGDAVGLIPTRYPGSQASEDPLIQMARKTEWIEHEADVYLGLGQRMLATDADDYSLMDIRQIRLATDEADHPTDVHMKQPDG